MVLVIMRLAKTEKALTGNGRRGGLEAIPRGPDDPRNSGKFSAGIEKIRMRVLYLIINM